MAGARKKNTYESHNGLSQLIMNSNTKKMGQWLKKRRRRSRKMSLSKSGYMVNVKI